PLTGRSTEERRLMTVTPETPDSMATVTETTDTAEGPESPQTPESNGTLYRLDNVSRIFRLGGNEVRAVDGVSLTIDIGEFIASEGPSGSGKSTMLQLLGALDRPTGGTLTFEDQDLGHLNEAARTKIRRNEIGFVFQSFNLIPTLTAAENVEAAMAPTRAGRTARVERVMELLGQVGLANRADHLPSRLSGGEQQRVAIAR